MDWMQIQQIIKEELQDIFAIGNPVIVNLDQEIALFRKVIYYVTQDRELNGLAKVMPSALQDAFVDKPGDLNSLKLISDSLEPYLKKIYVIAGLGNERAAKQLMLMPLIKALNINSSLSGPGQPYLTPTNCHTFTGRPEYLEQICLAYNLRNEVHVSPAWRRIEILTKLNATVAIYIYAAYVYRTAIKALPEIRPETSSIVDKIDPSEKYLFYYFISFGNTTNRIRNQIVIAYILQYLKETGRVSVDSLRTNVNSFFHADMDLAYYNNIIHTLTDDGKIRYDREPKIVELTESEVTRITKVQQSFDDDRNVFFLYFEEICSKFGLKDKMTAILDNLKAFFEANYQIDVAEGSSRGEKVGVDENQSYLNFSNYLYSLTGNKETTKELFSELVTLSKASDFLLKICASSVFAKMSNPDRFEQYIKSHDRIVYLDTQVILFALCLNYKENLDYSNFYYQTTNDLFALASRDTNICFKVSISYLQEVAHQLKLALMLIPFEELGGEGLSGNIFYKFYYHLKNQGILLPEDNSYVDFMANFFYLYEDDAFKHNYQSIAVKRIEEILLDLSVDIEIVDLPYCDRDPIETINQVLIEEKATPKSKFTIENDARMLAYLTDSQAHTLEPFFLTWDKQWTNYRKSYLALYERSNPISFHLFNPAKFINHYSLLKLKINPNAITNDLLSLMDSYNTYENGQTFWDQVNKFTNIENITKETKRRYMSKLVDLFNKEMQYTTAEIERNQRSVRMGESFNDLISKINEHYYHHNAYRLDDFRQIMLAESYFEKIAQLVIKSINNEEQEKKLLDGIDLLIKEFKEAGELRSRQ